MRRVAVRTNNGGDNTGELWEHGQATTVAGCEAKHSPREYCRVSTSVHACVCEQHEGRLIRDALIREGPQRRVKQEKRHD